MERQKKITLVLPFHVDSARLGSSCEALEKYSLANSGQITEVLFCQNGVANPSQPVSPNFPFRYLHTPNAGIGEGYALGIAAAASEWILLSASDLPFGFSDIEAMRGLNADIFLGSKLHAKSRVAEHGAIRLLGSYLFYVFRLILLGVNTPLDSQGTIMVRTQTAREILAKVKSRNFFFAVEFVYRAQQLGLRVEEVPVVLRDQSDDSSVHFIRDGFSLISNLVTLRFGSRNKST